MTASRVTRVALCVDRLDDRGMARPCTLSSLWSWSLMLGSPASRLITSPIEWERSLLCSSRGEQTRPSPWGSDTSQSYVEFATRGLAQIHRRIVKFCWRSRGHRIMVEVATGGPFAAVLGKTRRTEFRKGEGFLSGLNRAS